MSRKSRAAEQFLTEVRVTWDSAEYWEDSADGLSETDVDTITEYAAAAGEDAEAACAEVLAAVRAKVAADLADARARHARSWCAESAS